MNWHDYFYYDETSPTKLRWNVTRYSGEFGTRVMVSKGDSTGTGTDSNGYYQVTLDSKKYRVHRIIWELFHGELPEDLAVDHEDGVHTNNCITNLRIVPNALNTRNCTKAKNNCSGKTGVSYDKTRDRWVAYWSELDGKIVHKHFTVKKYGTEAFNSACQARDTAIERLNNLGAGYTARHGT